MRKKEARHIIRDWLNVLEWPSIPSNNDPFKQEELVSIITQERNLSALDREMIKETIQEIASEKSERR